MNTKEEKDHDNNGHSNDKVETIVVNGREKQWCEKTITFQQVVALAFENYQDNLDTVYTVTYAKGPQQNPEGSMVKGTKVFVINKMVFNVTATNKS